MAGVALNGGKGACGGLWGEGGRLGIVAGRGGMGKMRCYNVQKRWRGVVFFVDIVFGTGFSLRFLLTEHACV